MKRSLEIQTHALPTGMSLQTFSGNENPDLLREIESLRVRVWRAAGFPMRAGHEGDTHWGDDWDLLSAHFAILKGSNLVAVTAH